MSSPRLFFIVATHTNFFGRCYRPQPLCHSSIDFRHTTFYFTGRVHDMNLSPILFSFQRTVVLMSSTVSGILDGFLVSPLPCLLTTLYHICDALSSLNSFQFLLYPVDLRQPFFCWFLVSDSVRTLRYSQLLCGFSSIYEELQISDFVVTTSYHICDALSRTFLFPC